MNKVAKLCASILPPSGLRKDLFLSCLPVELPEESVSVLLSEGILFEKNGHIFKDQKINVQLGADDPSDHLIFLLCLYNHMQRCPCIETCEDFFPISEVFYLACHKFSGRNEEDDGVLANLYGQLLSLIKKDPFLHFIGNGEIASEERSTAIVLMNAEKTLAYNILKEAFSCSTSLEQLKKFKFVKSSIDAVIFHHRFLYPQETEELAEWQDLSASTVRAIVKTERILKLERRLASLQEKDGV